MDSLPLLLFQHDSLGRLHCGPVLVFHRGSRRAPAAGPVGAPLPPRLLLYLFHGRAPCLLIRTASVPGMFLPATTSFTGGQRAGQEGLGPSSPASLSLLCSVTRCTRIMRAMQLGQPTGRKGGWGGRASRVYVQGGPGAPGAGHPGYVASGCVVLCCVVLCCAKLSTSPDAFTPARRRTTGPATCGGSGTQLAVHERYSAAGSRSGAAC